LVSFVSLFFKPATALRARAVAVPASCYGNPVFDSRPRGQLQRLKFVRILFQTLQEIRRYQFKTCHGNVFPCYLQFIIYFRLSADVITYITYAHEEVLQAGYDTKDFLKLTRCFELVVEIAVIRDVMLLKVHEYLRFRGSCYLHNRYKP
jgi:hypothetical protein